MDPTQNPFAPGAGTAPPELAGRDALLSAAKIALARVAQGRHAKGQLLLGLRGVGKTVLLNRIAELAEEQGYNVVSLEAPEDRRLADMLVPPLRSQLFRLSRVEATKQVARRALSVLRAFAAAFKVSVGDIEFGVEPEVGTADSGDLEADLPEVFLATAQAAKAARRPIALLIDEVQYLSESDLAALLVSLHKTGQKGLPLILFGAGLPQLAALAGEAKSYAERLFDYPPVGPLSHEAAIEAIRAPILRDGASITDEALEIIIARTEGYPYFLQEWGFQVWNVAESSTITDVDAGRATRRALERLDEGFFRVRLDRLTPREKDYLRAMAELGAGPHRSGDIAQMLGIGVTTAAPIRNGLIKKGMIYSPQHGDTAFTVPLFDDFMRRTLSDWRPPAPVQRTRGRASKRAKKTRRRTDR
jgi:DNA-binding CsgD family transcriptional regulator